MPPKTRNVYEQQNRDFIKEQQVLRRELKMQEEAEKEKGVKRAERLKARYGQGQQKVQAAAPAAAAQAAQGGRGEKIEVFVRETEPAYAHHYTVYEGAPTATPLSLPGSEPLHGDETIQIRAASTPTPQFSCGTAGGMAGAARKKPAGHIPAYLKQRKQELQDEKDEIERQVTHQREMQKYPAGHVPLGEEEKEAILKGLNSKKDELLTEINKLPMRYDTTSIRNRRNNLEEQIREIEAKIGVFSRKQVFVPRS
eukprot:TRINITY_DN10595_c0_g1_i1.p1 TRINITY_DN10595_c0_g1~~TRINITY_DN10595_c0_g1_i1.p1  ORF type:complete len:268 (+),score=65.51 TRINITY_DN10595_c0_g1_i1:43-804(+)